MFFSNFKKSQQITHSCDFVQLENEILKSVRFEPELKIITLKIGL